MVAVTPTGYVQQTLSLHSISISFSHRPIWKITIFHKQFNTEIEKPAFCSWLMQVENPLSAIAFVEWSENLIHRKPLRLYTKPPGIFRYLHTIALLEWDENIEIAYIFRWERKKINLSAGIDSVPMHYQANTCFQRIISRIIRFPMVPRISLVTCLYRAEYLQYQHQR